MPISTCGFNKQASLATKFWSLMASGMMFELRKKQDTAKNDSAG